MDQSNMTPHNRRRKHLARTLAALASLPLILASLVTTAPAQGASDVGLVVHYPLDQVTGTTVVDESGAGRNGTLAGDATWLGGEGLCLGGTNGHVRLPERRACAASTTITVSVRGEDRSRPGHAVLHLGPRQHRRQRHRQRLPVHDRQRLPDVDRHRQLVDRADGHGRPQPRARHLEAPSRYTLAGGTAVLYEDGVEVARKHRRDHHARRDRRRHHDRELPRPIGLQRRHVISRARSATSGSTTAR